MTPMLCDARPLPGGPGHYSARLRRRHQRTLELGGRVRATLRGAPGPVPDSRHYSGHHEGTGRRLGQGVRTADLATGRLATDTTVYHLASITKPFASVVLLQLVQEGEASLDDPVSTFGVALQSSGTVRVRHLLSHTSEGIPGTTFRYNGDRFALLDTVVAQTAGRSFAAALQERIVATLGLKHTAPNPQSPSPCRGRPQPACVRVQLARGYSVAATATLRPHTRHFSVAAGLTASALDVAAFSMAMDRMRCSSPTRKRSPSLQR